MRAHDVVRHHGGAPREVTRPSPRCASRHENFPRAVISAFLCRQILLFAFERILKKLLRVLPACIIFASVYAPGRHTNRMNGRDAPNNKRRNKRCLDVRAAWLVQSPVSTRTSIRSDPIGNSELNQNQPRTHQINATRVPSGRRLRGADGGFHSGARARKSGCGVLRRAV